MTLVSTEQIQVNLLSITDPAGGPDGLMLVSPKRRLQVYQLHAFFQGFADFMINLYFRGVQMPSTGRTIASFLAADNSLGYVQWVDSYSDGSVLTTKFEMFVDRVKIHLKLVNGRVGLYTGEILVGNLFGFGTMVPVTAQGTLISFRSTDGTPISIDWTDVLSYTSQGVQTVTGLVSQDPVNLTVSLKVNVRFNGMGFVSVDPSIDGGGGSTGSDPQALRWNGKRLWGKGSDKFDRIWLVQGHASANCNFLYSNNGGTSFTAVDLGATFAVAGGPSAVAYDKTNDKFILGWAKAGDTKIQFAQGTISRDASNNITGVTMGSVLQITDNPSSKTGADIFRDIDGWFLSNGECGFTYGRNNPAGAMSKNNQTRFLRVVFGSPPSYKSLAGTASTVDDVGANDTGGDDRSFVNTAQDPFDNTLFVFWCHRVPGASNDTVVYKYSSGSLGGAWAAETTLYTAGASDFTTNGMDHRVWTMAQSSPKPQLMVCIWLGDNFGGGGTGQKDRIYGRTDGAALSQLDSNDIDLEALGNTHPEGCVCKGATNSAHIILLNSAINPPGTNNISLKQWNGTSFLSIQQMEAPTTVDRGNTFPKADTANNLVEVIYGNQPTSGGAWEIRYTSLNIAALTVAMTDNFQLTDRLGLAQFRSLQDNLQLKDAIILRTDKILQDNLQLTDILGKTPQPLLFADNFKLSDAFTIASVKSFLDFFFVRESGIAIFYQRADLADSDCKPATANKPLSLITTNSQTLLSVSVPVAPLQFIFSFTTPPGEPGAGTRDGTYRFQLDVTVAGADLAYLGHFRMVDSACTGLQDRSQGEPVFTGTGLKLGTRQASFTFAATDRYQNNVVVSNTGPGAETMTLRTDETSAFIELPEHAYQPVLRVDKVLRDQFSLKDIPSFNTHGMGFQDNLKLTDTLTLIALKILTDNLQLTDTLGKTQFESFQDNLQLDDVLVLATVKVLQDNLQLHDTLGLTQFLSLTDRFKLADILTLATVKALQDNLQLKDVLALAQFRSLQDNLQLKDLIVLRTDKVLQDSLQLTDRLSLLQFSRAIHGFSVGKAIESTVLHTPDALLPPDQVRRILKGFSIAKAIEE